MKMIFLLAFVFFIGMVAFLRLKNVKSQRSKLNRFNTKINLWMKMTREERNLFDTRVRKSSMERKKKLIYKSRKEYKNLNNRNS